MTTFSDFDISPNIQRALADLNFQTPTPIQQQAIPIVAAGTDLVGCAQTGTGKTAAFAIPIIDYIQKMPGVGKKHNNIRALIVTPTRELALQIEESFKSLGQYTRVRTTTIFGGVSQIPQVEQLKRGTEVLVATPGRLLDLEKQGFIDLNQLHILVLDEADQMLDMGFINDVKKIVKLTPNNRQTLLFSATMPLEIRALAEDFLNQPKHITVNPVSSTVERINQEIYFVEKTEKRNLLYHLIRNRGLSDVLVFSRTKHGADNIVRSLKKKGVEAEAIHGDKSQSARQRVLESFKNKSVGVLVATDIAARGIDIDALPFVINFDLPNIPETYVHRIGRTGRAGKEGTAISFCGRDEEPYWKDIIKLTRAAVTEIKDHPWPWVGAERVETLVADNAAKKGTSKSRKSTTSKKNKKRWY